MSGMIPPGACGRKLDDTGAPVGRGALPRRPEPCASPTARRRSWYSSADHKEVLMSMPDPNSLDPSARQAVAGVAKWWWLLLITGVLWLIIGGIVLQMDAQSLATVGYLVGFMLIFTGIEQFMVASAVPGWKWVWILFGVFFLLGGIWAVANPIGTSAALASSLGLLFVLDRHLLVRRGVRLEGLQPPVVADAPLRVHHARDGHLGRQPGPAGQGRSRCWSSPGSGRSCTGSATSSAPSSSRSSEPSWRPGPPPDRPGRRQVPHARAAARLGHPQPGCWLSGAPGAPGAGELG